MGPMVPEGPPQQGSVAGEHHHAAWWQGQVKNHILNGKQEAERTQNENSRPTPTDTLPPARLHLLSLPKQPPTGDQVF